MSNPESLAKPYAVVRPDGVVIDRVLLTDMAYEEIDWEARFPQCEILLDEANEKPIGFGAPVPEVPPVAPPPQNIDELVSRMAPEQRQTLLQALSELATPAVSTNTAA